MKCCTVYVIKYADLLYILVFILLCNLLVLPEIVRAFLSLPSFLIIPYRLGGSAQILIRQLAGRARERVLAIATTRSRTPNAQRKTVTHTTANAPVKFDLISNYIIMWCFGTISLVLIGILLNAFLAFSITNYVLLIILLILINVLLDMTQKRKTLEPIRKSLNLTCGDFRVVLMAMIISLVPVTYFMASTRFPLVIGMDTYNFVLYANQITQDNYLNPSPFWISIYPPTLPVSLAVSSVFFNVSPLSLFWTLPFLLYPLFSLGIYLFSYQLSKRADLALIAAVIGVASTGYSRWVYINSLYYIIPKNIIYLLFPLILFLILRNIRTKKSEISEKILTVFAGITSSALVFSVLSLTFSNAPHHLPQIYSLFLFLLFFAFLAVEKVGGAQKSVRKLVFLMTFLIIYLVLLFSFFALLPLSEQEIPHLKIYSGLVSAIAISPFLFAGRIRNIIDIQDFTVFLLVTMISFFFHFYMGLIVIFVVYFYILSRFLAEKTRSLAILIFSGIIGSCILLVILQQSCLISLDIVANIMPSIFRVGREFDLPIKNQMLNNSYNFAILILSFIGTAVFLVRKKTMAVPLISLFSLLLFLFFFPSEGTYRFLTYLTPFVSFLAANTLLAPYWMFPRFLRIKLNKRFVKALYVLIVLVALTPFISQPHIQTLEALIWKPYYSPSSVDYNEIQAADWTAENTPKDTIVISEPNTQLIFAALANREESYFLYGVEDINVRSILETTNASKAYEMILEYRQLRIKTDSARAILGSRILQGNRPVVVAINGRVSRMTENPPNVTYGPGVPVWFKAFDGFYKFYNSTYFTLLHNVNEQIYIFGVKINGTLYAN